MTTSLTKHIVARQQLAVAIRLLFDGADLVAIYTLAANAWEIIDFLATRKGIDSLSNQTRQNLADGGDLKFDYINYPHRNFFKHADRDPDGVVPFLKEENVEALIYLAVEDYIRLYETSPIELQVYQLWFLAKNEGKVSSRALDRVLDTTRKAFPDICRLPRKEQLSMARHVLMSSYSDTELQQDSRTE